MRSATENTKFRVHYKLESRKVQVSARGGFSSRLLYEAHGCRDHSLSRCLLVSPFSVMVACIAEMWPVKMYD